MRALLAAVAILVPVSAHALRTPDPTNAGPNADPHVRSVPYIPGQQILLVGSVSRPMTIVFGPTEHVLRVPLETNSIGPDGKDQSAPWIGQTSEDKSSEVLGNTLPLWPTRVGRSSAQVITLDDVDHTRRIYPFQMIALPAQPQDCGRDDCDDPRIITQLTFVYPAVAKPIDLRAQQEAVAKRDLAKQQLAIARLKTDVFYGTANWSYEIKGTPVAKHRLAPEEISDNTQSTKLRFPGRRRAPSIYIVEHGEERQITPETDQDLLVVHEAASLWRLRDGNDRDSVVDICRGGFDKDGKCPEADPVGDNPWTGTSSPNVIRTVRQ